LLITGDLPFPDPFSSLATPNYGNGVLTDKNFGDKNVTIPGAGATTTLDPGIYTSISITGGGQGTVKFNPGIYVLKPTNPGTTLTINNTGGPVTGTNVMFYNTGSDYDPSTGLPDVNDATNLGSSTARFGDININSQSLTLSGIQDTASPFYGIVFYQRRLNNQTFKMAAQGANVNISGTIYAKGALFDLGGGSYTYNSPIIVGSVKVSGQATINAGVGAPSSAYQVYLVE
jgi:hypothetical protein